MVDHILQRRLLQLHLGPWRYDVGQNYLGGSSAIGVHGARASPHQIQKSMKLRLCVMEPTGTGPTVGATKYRRITVFIRDAA